MTIHRSLGALFALAMLLPACNSTDTEIRQVEEAMLVQYLEIVTPEVDATCDALEKQHGVSFGESQPELGNARLAALESGGKIGVRAPMAAHEEPVVRPYVLVDDIEAALSAATAAGGDVAMASTPIPGGGNFAIYILGGIQHGLWQLDEK